MAALVKIVDDAAAGQAAPNDLGVTWVHEDYLKAQGNKRTRHLRSRSTRLRRPRHRLFYWRVVSKNAALLPPP